MFFVERRLRYRYLLVFGLLFSLTVPASANMGSTLMLAGMGHLFVGNAIIGVVEALFIARIYKVRYDLIVPLAIAANYTSMVCGIVLTIDDLVTAAISNTILGNTPLYRLPLFLGVMIAITLSLSILIEWPYYRAAFMRNRQLDISECGEANERRYGARHILRVTVLAQLVSYLLLAVYYLAVLGTGFIRNARITHGLDFIANAKTSIYYVDGNKHYRIRLDGSAPVQVSEKEMQKVITRYEARYADEDNNFSRVMRTSFHSNIFDLRPKHSNGWQGHTDFWGTNGLALHNEQTGEHFDLGLELPFVRWTSEYATLLPGDQVIYQFGPQIVLFDIKSRRMAFVAKGEQPVVVIE